MTNPPKRKGSTNLYIQIHFDVVLHVAWHSAAGRGKGAEEGLQVQATGGRNGISCRGYPLSVDVNERDALPSVSSGLWASGGTARPPVLALWFENTWNRRAAFRLAS
jgi:hypothetical protein